MWIFLVSPHGINELAVEQLSSPLTIGEYMAKKLYDFLCGECSHEFEKLVESTNKVECPNCGSTNTHVKFNTPSVKVKGGYDSKMRV